MNKRFTAIHSPLTLTAIKLSDSRRAGETRAAPVQGSVAARVSPALQFCTLNLMVA